MLAALNYPDVRTQLLAANAILRLDPKRHFRGADRVISILTRALTNSHESKALIVDADAARAEVTAGYLSNLGYTPVLASTGKEGFRLASTTAGIELAVIDINVIQWDLSQTMANLRADARTAYLPIVIYGPEDVTDVETRSGRKNALAFPEAASTIWHGTLPPGKRVEPIDTTTRNRIARLLQRSQPAVFIAESGSAADFTDQVKPFLVRVAGSELSAEERDLYQAGAVRWLAQLATVGRSDLFNLSVAEKPLADLLESPDFVDTALIALSGIGSNDIQRRFKEIALNSQREANVRTAAARQLALHIQQFGVMLTEDDIKEIAQTWNEESDSAVTSALAAVMGSLKPDSNSLRNRISRLPAPK